MLQRYLQTSKFYRYDTTSTSRCSLCNSRPAAITALAVVLLLLNLPVNRWTLLLALPLLYTRITILINLVILPSIFVRTTPSLLLVSYG